MIGCLGGDNGRTDNSLLFRSVGKPHYLSDELKREFGDQVTSSFTSQYYSLSQVAEILGSSTEDLLRDIECRRFTAHERVKVVDDVSERYSHVPVPDTYITRILADQGTPFVYVISDDDSYDAWLKNGFIWNYPSQQKQDSDDSKSLVDKRIESIQSVAQEVGFDLSSMQYGDVSKLRNECVSRGLMTESNFDAAYKKRPRK